MHAEKNKKRDAVENDVRQSFIHCIFFVFGEDEFDGLVETLDILTSKEERDAIARAKAQVRKGQTVSLKSIKNRYGIK